MWICLNNSFLSIISPSPRSKTLDVRARARGDIERVFPDAKVITLPGRDYAFRAHIDRRDVAEVISREIAEISYPNFKGSVKEQDRHDAYYGFWNIMARFQEDRGHGYPYQTTSTGKGRKRGRGQARRAGIAHDARALGDAMLPFNGVDDDFDTEGEMDSIFMSEREEAEAAEARGSMYRRPPKRA